MDRRILPTSHDLQALPETGLVSFPRTRSDGDLSTRGFSPPILEVDGSNGLIVGSSRFEPASSDPSSNQSPTSQATSSSQQTSSDKLSALPTSQSTSNPHRILRPPNVPSSSNHVRGYRRSLDASASLPSFVAAEYESPRTTINNLNSRTFRRGTVSAEVSPEKPESPRQRVSFDSDRGSSPAKHSIRQVISRLSKGSDGGVASPALRSSAYAEHLDSQKDLDSPGNRSPSQSRSRAASPLRILQQWSAGLHRSHRTPAEDPFVPVDPFRRKARRLRRRLHIHAHPPDIEQGSVPGSLASQTQCPGCVPTSSFRIFLRNVHLFVTDVLPRQIYLHFLLRLPAMYFTRVARIFEDAEVSRPDIERMIDARGGGGAYMMPSVSETVPAYPGMAGSNHGREPGVTLSPSIASAGHLGVAVSAHPYTLPFPDDWSPPVVSPALIRFKHSWEAFIDSLLREWKTLNVVSALLLSAILTMFQIPTAEGDPITRTAALLSLISALMSLSYGCMFIVRFGTMRSMYRASRWAEEARKTNTVIWWNVWVLLAMPVVWLSWSMLLFVISVLSFVWRTGSAADPQQRTPLSPNGALAARIAITSVFALGMLFMILIVRTLKRYSTHEEPPPSQATVRKPASYRSEPKASVRARDIDAAMERRGRERQRSTSGRKRREEEPGVRDRVGSGDGDVAGREKAGLKATLGLGLTGLGIKDTESDVDLEKGSGDEK